MEDDDVSDNDDSKRLKTDDDNSPKSVRLENGRSGKSFRETALPLKIRSLSFVRSRRVAKIRSLLFLFCSHLDDLAIRTSSPSFILTLPKLP